QIRLPSKAIPSAPAPRFDATTVAAPAGAAGSIRGREPGAAREPATKNLAIAITPALANGAPGHVSGQRPSLGRAPSTGLVVRSGIQRSLPSQRTLFGLMPTVVRPRSTAFFGVQKRPIAARRETR